MQISAHYINTVNSNQPTQRLTKQQRILTILFVVSFALDFKGSVGGSPIQFIMAGMNIVTFLLLAISNRVAIPSNGLAVFVFWGWLAFLIAGTAGAIANATPFGHFIRIAYAFILFFEGFLVALWSTRDTQGAKLIVSAMLATALISLVFTLVWGFYFTGDNVQSIRYQILSPLIPLLIIIAGYDWLFAKRKRFRSFFILMIVFGIILLSVTRGMILMMSFVAILVLLAAFINVLGALKFPRPLAKGIVTLAITAVIGTCASILFYPEAIVRWVHRGLGAGHDVNFWTRVAAILGQYQTLTANHYSWLIGQGFGSTYIWPLSAFPWILKYMGPGAIGRSAWFPGEFMWMPFLFYGGFFAGLIAIVALLAGGIRAFRLLAILLKKRSWKDLQMRPLWIGILGYFSFLGIGFTANPFILRLAAMFMGLCLGLVLTQGKILMRQRPACRLDI